MKFSAIFILGWITVVSATFDLKSHFKSKAQAQVQPLPPTKTVSHVKFPTTVVNQGPFSVPVISSHTLHVVPVAVDVPVYHPRIITVEPTSQAVHFLFKSVSSPLVVRQQHTPSGVTMHEITRSQDQPHVLRHEVLKPVVQELRETIQPYRKVTQEIRPVLEEVRVVVPKGQRYLPSQQHPVQQQLEDDTQQTEQQILEQSYEENVQTPQVSQNYLQN